VFTSAQRLQEVTQQGVQEAAARHLHPDRQTVVVVGDAGVVGPALRAAGLTQVAPLALERQ
jgi:predicted Zn-dependent peptidase